MPASAPSLSWSNDHVSTRRSQGRPVPLADPRVRCHRGPRDVRPGGQGRPAQARGRRVRVTLVVTVFSGVGLCLGRGEGSLLRSPVHGVGVS